MPQKKTTPKQFQIFKREFLRLVAKFGITDWYISFYHEDIEDAVASCTPCDHGQRAFIRLATKLSKEDYDELDLKALARHEFFHLLTADLFNAAWDRFTTREKLKDEWERLVCRLENVVKV